MLRHIYKGILDPRSQLFSLKILRTVQLGPYAYTYPDLEK